jgi:NCAIR mutase (PurE)-related protein
MNENALRTMLEQLVGGDLSADSVVEQLQRLPFEDIAGARLDHHRSLRCGFGEVIFCLSKTVEQVVGAFTHLADRGETVLATRATQEMADAVAAAMEHTTYCPVARTILWRAKPAELTGHVAIVAAGTSDMPVAEEARVTAEAMGAHVTTHYDCGVAGLHRLLAEIDTLRKARVVVAVAGMEGALPSVLAGLIPTPIIAVPTSVGYGTHFGGVSALLTMLNSCATGVTVVNIDNGYAGGYNAAMINRVK